MSLVIDLILSVITLTLKMTSGLHLSRVQYTYLTCTPPQWLFSSRGLWRKILSSRGGLVAFPFKHTQGCGL